MRRAITAATAAALGFLGALLGIAGAYAALVACYLDEPWPLGHVPFVHLAVVAVGPAGGGRGRRMAARPARSSGRVIRD